MAASSLQLDLPDEETFSKEIGSKAVAGVLQVVEVFQNWCGPSKAVVATLKRFINNNPDAPVKFYTANVSKVSALARFEGHCEPAFLFYKDGKVLEEVVGLALPKITRLLTVFSSSAGAAVAHRETSEE